MKILNSMGPRIDMCGTPDKIPYHTLNILFNFIICFREHR